MQRKILVLAAHPDDEVLGCGGLIHKAGQENHVVRVVCFCAMEDNAKGFAFKRAVYDLNEAATTQCLGYEDQMLDQEPLKNLALDIEKQIQRFQPTDVYTHRACDVNQDHRAIAEATLIAARPLGAAAVDRVYAYDVVGSSTGWNFSDPSHSNVYLQLSASDLEAKLRTMQRVYKEELRQWPHPRSIKGIRYHARTQGAIAGFAHGVETFELLRELRTKV